jgi:hypothetical protein
MEPCTARKKRAKSIPRNGLSTSGVTRLSPVDFEAAMNRFFEGGHAPGSP